MLLKTHQNRMLIDDKKIMIAFLGWLVSVLLLGGCISDIPAKSYGVNRLDFAGVNNFDEYAIRACLATKEIERTSLGLDRVIVCNKPPFDQKFHPRFGVWPWKDWPTLDHASFERDVDRIERWYRARGYYDAEVVEIRFKPEESATSDEVKEGKDKSCDSRKDVGCETNILIKVKEGKPIHIRQILFDFSREIKKEFQEELLIEANIKKGDIFDEYYYEQTKKAILKKLRDETYACAQVKGQVVVNRQTHEADIQLKIIAGPTSVIGDLMISGYEDLSEQKIYAASNLESGQPYREEELVEAQHAIYALGAFSGVDIEGLPRRDSENQCEGVVDIEIRVTPGKRFRYGIGFGFGYGQYTKGEVLSTTSDWDVHLLGFVEHRNFLGGLRRIRLEARPKLLLFFLNPLDIHDEPLGLAFQANFSFRQPSFVERKVSLSISSQWDYGPDPNEGFPRHDFEMGVYLTREYWHGKIGARVGFRGNLQRVLRKDSSGALLQDLLVNGESNKRDRGYSDHEVVFTDISLRLDLRDDAIFPTLGLFAEMQIQQAGIWLPSSWDYWRLTPDVRVYLPFVLNTVLATRFAMGAMMITRVNTLKLDDVSRTLGPQRYRLRGGGANSNRGFIPGFMGEPETIPAVTGINYAQNSGGLSRWEASVELRIPLTPDFIGALFADFGDVSRKELNFRFNYIRMALGFGFRLQTPVGPFRFDLGFLIPGAQVLGGSEPEFRQTIFGIPMAFHFVIGEAF